MPCEIETNLTWLCAHYAVHYLFIAGLNNSNKKKLEAIEDKPIYSPAFGIVPLLVLGELDHRANAVEK